MPVVPQYLGPDDDKPGGLGGQFCPTAYSKLNKVERLSEVTQDKTPRKNEKSEYFVMRIRNDPEHTVRSRTQRLTS